MTPLRVLLADDMRQVRQDLQLVLSLWDEIAVVGEAENGLEAVHQAELLQPDVILMDLEMPNVNGYEAIKLIKQQLHSCRIIALTVHDYPQARERAFSSGADAFFVKGEPFETLIQTIFIQKGCKP